MAQWLEIFNKVSTIGLLGPSNSGKTSFFLRDSLCRGKKIIISVVALNDLKPLNENITIFDHIKYINLTEEMSLTNFDNKEPCCILIDEIHLFQDHHLSRLAKVLESLNIEQLYISLLPGSFKQNILPNVAQVLCHINNMLVISGTCVKCSKKTIRSGKIINFADTKNDIQIGKGYFNAICYQCSAAQNI